MDGLGEKIWLEYEGTCTKTFPFEEDLGKGTKGERTDKVTMEWEKTVNSGMKERERKVVSVWAVPYVYVEDRLSEILTGERAMAHCNVTLFDWPAKALIRGSVRRVCKPEK
ncbi:hypothetical protein E2542_SST11420 [Spatholobus suberectus]|nr:hypothetical protein E2542_SST11420 [Spatholobus suberectus]